MEVKKIGYWKEQLFGDGDEGCREIHTKNKFLALLFSRVLEFIGSAHSVIRSRREEGRRL